MLKTLISRMSSAWYIFSAMLLLVTLGCGAAAPSSENAPDPSDPKEPIVFSDLSWDSAQLQNRIAMYIVENGYGYPVDTLFGDTIPLFNGLIKGDTQVTMEIWLPNQQEAWDKAVADGSVLAVGHSLDDNWQSAFVIPTYVANETPDYDRFKTCPNSRNSSPPRRPEARPGWSPAQLDGSAKN